MRYADVLLNAAEAAVELSLAGEPSPDGSDLLKVATDAVNDS
jgi:SusD family.